MSTDSQPAETPPSPSCKSARAWCVLLGIAVIGLVADLWSKAYAFAHVAGVPVVIDRADVIASDDLNNLIPYHESMTVIGSVLDFRLVLNPGAVFGIGAGQRWFFVVFTIIAIVIALVLFVRWTQAKDWIAHAGFGLIIAGGIGNLYDRLMFACVRDFIHPAPGVQLPFGLKWPNSGSTDLWPYVSNVADAFLIVGIVMLMIHAWKMPTPEQSAPEVKPETGTT